MKADCLAAQIRVILRVRGCGGGLVVEEEDVSTPEGDSKLSDEKLEVDGECL